MDAAKVKVTAKAVINGKPVEKASDPAMPIALLDKQPLRVHLKPDGESGRMAEDGVLEFTIRPGETITAIVAADRNGSRATSPLARKRRDGTCRTAFSSTTSASTD